MKQDISPLLFYLVFLPLPVIAMLLYTAESHAEETLTGRDIALRMEAADTSKDAYRRATMVIERGSKKLVRKLETWLKKYGEDERSLTRFNEPADVRDTQFLSWVYDAVEQNDDLWVYFPTENLVRRISGGGKKGSFMRSDFANEDIESRAVDDDVHTLLEETTLNERPVYVLDSVPIPIKAKDSNYAKRRLWVDKEYWLPLKIEFYDKRDRVLKVMEQGGIENIDGIWTATKIIMQT
ncbi:MAG: outer membrane lipoprotein-sorting protein, partial [Pseudomonadota bacterium]